MSCVRFLAPTLAGRLKKTDTLVVRGFSGRNAGPPTDRFNGVRPIVLADLLAKGRIRPTSVEFIPLTKGTVKVGTRLTNFAPLGNCLLGEDLVPRYRGQTFAAAGWSRALPRPARPVKRTVWRP